jgi:hypothetical protein
MIDKNLLLNDLQIDRQTRAARASLSVLLLTVTSQQLFHCSPVALSPKHAVNMSFCGPPRLIQFCPIGKQEN